MLIRLANSRAPFLSGNKKLSDTENPLSSPRIGESTKSLAQSSFSMALSFEQATYNFIDFTLWVIDYRYKVKITNQDNLELIDD